MKNQATSLFSDFSIADLTLPNRLVRSATLENMASPDGSPTDATRRLYERLAAGGAGLIITGYAYVSKAGQSYPLQHGMHSDGLIPSWRQVTDAVHERGGRIMMQIAHGGRQTKPSALGGREGLAPSGIPSFIYFHRPRRMTEGEILTVIDEFTAAALRAKEAGFDGVQIHGAHGYLLSNFLSPLLNRRRDAWGGDRQRRLHLLEEIVKEVRRVLGDRFALLLKINSHDYVPFGFSPRESIPAILHLAGLGLDAVEVSGGTMESVMAMTRGDSPAAIVGRDRTGLARAYLSLVLALQTKLLPFREAYFLPFAKRIKRRLPIPLILVGGIRSPATAERILRSGQADLLSLSRPFIREPALPRRWHEGSLEPARCTSCNRCFGEIEQSNPLRCYLRKGSEEG